jgi:hypothetical protein
MKNIKEKLTYLRFHLVRSISTLLTEWAFPLELSMSSPPIFPSLSYTYTNNQFHCQSERRWRFRIICALNKLNWGKRLETKNLIFDFSVFHILGVSVSDLRPLERHYWFGIFADFRMCMIDWTIRAHRLNFPEWLYRTKIIWAGLHLMGWDLIDRDL